VAETPGEELRAQLEEALSVVAAEAPAQFAAMRAQLGTRAALIRVGSSPALRVCVAHDPPWVERATDEGARAAIELALSETALSRLLRGRSSIEEAILNESLSVRGEVADLLAFFEGLAAWLHGALRSPSLPTLHQRCLAKGPPPC
jgi:hypothetical protein